jgi:DNA-binding LacI/PurR family transcriptional regulator
MNITDVAREAGVSIATVSRVVNNNDYPVRPETRERVLDAVRRLGFRPNDLARGLLQKRTRTVGLIVPDLANPYYPEIARGVEDAASAELYAVVFCNTDRRADKSEHYVDTLLQKRVDGIIIAGGGTDFTHASTAFAEFGAPVVFIGRHRAGGHSVQIDNVAAARGATAHLAALGHREIAFVTGPLTLTSVQDRLAGYRAGLEAAGLGWDDRLVREGDFGERSGYEAARAALAAHPRPTAIFAANDLMAIGAMAAARDAGLAVPEDVSIVGFDGIELGSFVRPALTTVAIPTYEMGAAAMRMLLELVGRKQRPEAGAGPPPERTVRLETELVTRDSSAAAPGGATRPERAAS